MSRETLHPAPETETAARPQSGKSPAQAPQLPPYSARRGLFIVLVLIAAALGLALRLPNLSDRPMHTDEAVHALKLAELLDNGTYIYNPHEYHGPTLYYFTLPLLWISGIHRSADIPDETLLRLVPVLFGTGLILLLLLMGDGLGRPAAAVAAVLTALSPGMVFYSRYYIQEMLLVFFTFGALAAGWRYTRRHRLGWAVAAGACLGLMHASKETCVIPWAAMIAAGGLTFIWARWVDGRKLRLSDYLRGWHVIVALHVTVAVSLLLLTAFLNNPKATWDAIHSVNTYLVRGASGDSSTHGAAVHDHIWDYYFHLLGYQHNGPGPWWSEGVILVLALFGIFFMLRPRHARISGNINLQRFIAFTTILMMTVYSAIPYKTPWCMLGFLHGLILLAGIGTAALWVRLHRFWKVGSRAFRVRLGAVLRAALALALIAAAWNLGAQAVRSITTFSSDPRNPYVYGHTSSNILRLVRRVEDLAAAAPDGRRMIIRILAPKDDYWPLPWYLRRFPNVGYYNQVPPAPEDLEASLIVASEVFEETLDERIKDSYAIEYYSLRPGVLMTAKIRQDLLDAVLAKKAIGK